MDPGHFGEIWLNGPGAECSAWRTISKWSFKTNISLDYASLKKKKKKWKEETLRSRGDLRSSRSDAPCAGLLLDAEALTRRCKQLSRVRKVSPDATDAKAPSFSAADHHGRVDLGGGSRGKWDDIQPVWIHGCTFKRTSVTLTPGVAAAANCVRFV